MRHEGEEGETRPVLPVLHATAGWALTTRLYDTVVLMPGLAHSDASQSGMRYQDPGMRK